MENNLNINTTKEKFYIGIDNIFEKNKEFSLIGTKTEYQEYINNIFPETTKKNIFWHGTAQDVITNGFDVNKSNTIPAVFFTTNKVFADSFGEKRDLEQNSGYTGATYGAVLNIQKNFDYAKDSENLKPILKNLIQQKYVNKEIGVNFSPVSIFLDNQNIDNPSNEQILDWLLWRIQNGSWRILEIPEIGNYLKENYDSFNIKESGADTFAVFEKNQIHLLGTPDDLENFKNYMNKNKS